LDQIDEETEQESSALNKEIKHLEQEGDDYSYDPDFD